MMIISAGQKRELSVPLSQEVEIITLEKGAHLCMKIDGAGHAHINVILAGENAVLDIKGIFIGASMDEQEITLNVTQDAPRTSCNVRFRTALDDASVSRFDGLIRMTKQAIDSHARLSYRGILLSKQSRCIPTPRLEILTKRVASASHEASVGTIDLQQLFYLQSRGLSSQEAKNLLIKGFLDVMPKITMYDMV